MLQIILELDEEMIKEKYLQIESEKNFKFLGSRKSEMNEKIDEILITEGRAKDTILEIRNVESQRLQFSDKISRKLSLLEN